MYDWRECFKEIDSGSLGKSSSNEPGFVFVDLAVRQQFNFENPLRINQVRTMSRVVDDLLGLILVQRLNLILNCKGPQPLFFIGNSLLIALWSYPLLDG